MNLNYTYIKEKSMLQPAVIYHHIFKLYKKTTYHESKFFTIYINVNIDKFL